MTHPPLPVYLYGRHVADVLDAGFGDTAVRYTDDTIDAPVGRRLSLSLPIQAETHVALGAGGVWVRSLLPEGRALAAAVSYFGVAEQDRYSLIAALGADVAGAVQVLLPDTEPESTSTTYEPVTHDDIAQLLHRADGVNLGLAHDRRVRLSLAGVQDKLLLHRSNGVWLRPIGGAASSVILKPEPPSNDESRQFQGIATVELFCLRLAASVGLATATASLETFGQTPTLVVERYDRTVDADGTLQRIHQEDLLSALGQDPLLKYEEPISVRIAPAGGFADPSTFVSRSGPSAAHLAQLLGAHLGRANLGPFLSAVAFNIAIGNADAHARNYSVVLTPDGSVELAPLYDLVATRYWGHLDLTPAQRINGLDNIDAISATDLAAEATRWEIPGRVAQRWIDGLLDRIAQQLEPTANEVIASGGESSVVEQLVASIRDRVDRMRTPQQPTA